MAQNESNLRTSEFRTSLEQISVLHKMTQIKW